VESPPFLALLPFTERTSPRGAREKGKHNARAAGKSGVPSNRKILGGEKNKCRVADQAYVKRSNK
jgi:hypothetical protein